MVPMVEASIRAAARRDASVGLLGVQEYACVGLPQASKIKRLGRVRTIRGLIRPPTP